jgi:hypothetical protein
MSRVIEGRVIERLQLLMSVHSFSSLFLVSIVCHWFLE